MIKDNIVKLHQKLINKELNVDTLINDSINYSKEFQKECNAFVTIIDKPEIKDVNDDLLSCIPFGVKDNYSTKGILSTGSSNTLKDYVPIYTATAVQNLLNHGAVMTNKTALDEFGMGGTGTTCHTGTVLNPWNKEKICGGSSCGSAAAVAGGVYPFALGSDTGDSIRRPAALCGIVGYKPTYGMISRFGLFPYASSMDTCGVLTRCVTDAAITVDAMKGLDKNDLTTWDSRNIKLYNNLNKDLKGKKLFYIKEIVDYNNYPDMNDTLKKHLDNYYKTIDILKENGAEIYEESIDISLLNAISSVYACIADAEATSNMSNLTGISFGPRGIGNNFNEIMKDHRTKGFSPLIKRRFIIGSYVLQKENQEKYFVNAMRIRRKIVDIFKDLFKKYDALIMPVGNGYTPDIKDCDKFTNKEGKLLDDYLIIGNFGGFPSITIPNGIIDNMPVGINITGNCYDDQNILNIAYGLESLMPYKNMIAKDGNHE